MLDRALTLALLATVLPASLARAQWLTSQDLLEWEPTPVTARISYGDDPLQFAELRLPEGDGPFPVAVVIHGGCWLSMFDITHMGRLASALAEEGIATWSVEYRRFGDPGAGWPATFLDVAQGTDHLRVVAESYPVDLEKVLAVGHSAGGQFALWLAGRPTIAQSSEIYLSDPLPIHAVLAISPAPDLAAVQEMSMCGGAMEGIMGGSAQDFPQRYRAGSPIEMAPLQVPQLVVKGRHDMPPLHPMIADYVEHQAAAGTVVEIRVAEQSGHFEVVDPTSSVWPMVRAAALELMARD